jgi:hypothetical protein
MKFRPISLSEAGTDDQGRFVYMVRFMNDSREEREHTFTVDVPNMELIEWDSQFYITTHEDQDSADALVEAVRKFHEARSCQKG